MANYTIPDNIKSIILECTVTDMTVILPDRQLPREDYEAVDKALRNLGGKWKRGKGHVFDSAPRPKIAALNETGVAVDEQKLFQAFYTPPALAEQLVGLAEISFGDYVLEPSAGEGAIVLALLRSAARSVTAVELNLEAYRKLKATVALVSDLKPEFVAYQGDFLRLSLKQGDFDRVVMNPPFSKNQDITHVERALSLLRPGGILVAVMSPNDRRTGVRRILEAGKSEITEVPAGTFTESGTPIATIIVKVMKT